MQSLLLIALLPAAALLFYVWKLSDIPQAVELREKLRALTSTAAFRVDYGNLDRWRMRWMLLSMRVCRLFAFSSSKAVALDTRIARARDFLKRDCTLWNKVLYGSLNERDG